MDETDMNKEIPFQVDIPFGPKVIKQRDPTPFPIKMPKQYFVSNSIDLTYRLEAFQLNTDIKDGF